VIASPADMLRDPGSWDIALPSTSLLGPPPVSVHETRSYYWWPTFVVTREGVPVGLDALRDGTVCVVAGSVGEVWATHGSVSGTSSTVPAPAGLRVVVRPRDAACLDELRAGGVDAAVTATLTSSDVASTAGVIAIEDGPVVREARAALVRDASDKPGLLAAVEAALAAAQADGTLSALAKSRFGGEDLASSPVP
jgi:ABC-type amino acid transport substrate-binding protein